MEVLKVNKILWDKVTKLLDNGKMILAVKLLREEMGIYLIDAKYAVDCYKLKADMIEEIEDSVIVPLFDHYAKVAKELKNG